MEKKKMNIKDIPEFTDPGSYQIDQPIRDIPKWVQEHQEEMGLELNPDFQRGHVWTPEQETAYMEFVLRGGNTGRDLFFNHPGWMTTFEGDFVCVDGLQRLTAVLRFMDDKVPVFGGYVASQIEGLERNLCRYSFKIHINNLQSRRDVLKWYLEMNEGGTPHSQEELDRIRKMISETKKEGAAGSWS